jgi:probable rRNA maturation factor
MESEGKKTILGDLMITPKKLEKDYKEISDGYRKLIIHGLLHLLGFDHIKDSEFKKMSLAESNILQELNNY